MKIINFKGTETFAKELNEEKVLIGERITKEINQEHEDREIKKANKIKDLKQLLMVIIVAVLIYVSIGYYAISKMVILDDLLFFIFMSFIIVPILLGSAVKSFIEIYKR